MGAGNFLLTNVLIKHHLNICSAHSIKITSNQASYLYNI